MSREAANPERVVEITSQTQNSAGVKNGRPEWTRTIDLFRVNSKIEDGGNENE